METVKKILKYLDGELSMEEKKQFEALIGKDPRLAADADFIKEINEAILDDDVSALREKLREILDPEGMQKPVSTPRTLILRIAVAASVIMLVSLAAGYLIFRDSSTRLFAEYYQPYQTFIRTRSHEASRDDFMKACLFYQEGKYQESFEIFKTFLDKEPQDPAGHFYLGLCALELQQFDLAIREFTRTEQGIETPYSLHAQWYLALAYLETKQFKEARKYLDILTSEKNIYTAEARKIKRKL
jgi:tetratricopeptide (TPR) repeat protein